MSLVDEDSEDEEPAEPVQDAPADKVAEDWEADDAWQTQKERIRSFNERNNPFT